MKTVALVSGGIDSTIMAYEFPDALRLFVNFGQNYAREEWAALRSIFGGTVHALKLNHTLPSQNDRVYIPNRNLTLASLAVTVYGADEVLIAGLKDDNCTDKNPEAFKKMSLLLSEMSEKHVRVHSPYFGQTKGEVVQRFLANIPDGEAILNSTFSCYSPDENGIACLNCEACFRKMVALRSNGIYFPMVSNTIVNKYLSKLHTYDSDRISRTLIALNYNNAAKYSVRAIDIDGVLCEDGNPYDKPYEYRKPFVGNIQEVNKLKGTVVLYTSRLESDRKVTEEWLKLHGVQYHALIMNKIPYLDLVDDKATDKLT